MKLLMEKPFLLQTDFDFSESKSRGKLSSTLFLQEIFLLLRKAKQKRNKKEKTRMSQSQRNKTKIKD